jgi:MarC family membrane protein
VPVTWEQVSGSRGGSVGRPHVATALVELGVVPSVSDAFTGEWLADGGRAYVEKHETDPFEAIRLVKAAGGVTVFAHPAAAKRGHTVPESAIAELAAAGLDGIEVDHMDHEPRHPGATAGARKELGLLPTGSSDYHGSRKSVQLGEYTTDPEVYGEITRRATGAFPGAGGRRSLTSRAPSERTPLARLRSLSPARLRGSPMFDVAVFGSLFLTLFVIMDPPGITPIFLALTAGRPAKVQKRMAFQAVCVAGGVITVFGLLGHQILDYLHVSVPALMIAGGLLLLLIALDLLTGKTDEPKQTKDVNVALVPLGMPLLAGPGAIVSVILAVQKADSVAVAGVGVDGDPRHPCRAVGGDAVLAADHPGHQGRRGRAGDAARGDDALRDRRAADHQRRHPGRPSELSPRRTQRRTPVRRRCRTGVLKCGRVRMSSVVGITSSVLRRGVVGVTAL